MKRLPLGAILLLLLLWLGVVSVSARADGPPNVILCMGDDHGWEETGYNGHPFVKTPVLDEMAASGLRLDRFYAAHPTCSPTRGSVLTGRHPNRYGTFTPNHSIRPQELTIAHLLGQAGYLCGHFGKWHVGPVKLASPTSPGAMGFDRWLSHDNFFELDPVLSRDGGPPEQIRGEGSEIIVDEAIEFIREAKQDDKRFLVVIWFGSPHEPYSGLPRDLALYDDLPQELQDRSVSLTSNETGRGVKRPLREVLRERFAEITAMDRSIGTLRDFLRAEGLRDDTLLWYCGDNGTPAEGQVASPFRGRKGQMYEGGVRVPGLIEWPARIASPTASSVNAVTSDILPTLCTLTGQPLPDRPIDGIDLVPLIDGTMRQRAQPICFWSYDVAGPDAGEPEPYIEPELQRGTTPLVKRMGNLLTRNFRNDRHPEIRPDDFAGPRAVLDQNFKLVIHDGKGGPQRELFDLQADPAEQDNRIDSHPDRAEAMERHLRSWQQSVLQSLTGADYTSAQ